MHDELPANAAPQIMGKFKLNLDGFGENLTIEPDRFGYERIFKDAPVSTPGKSEIEDLYKLGAKMSATGNESDSSTIPAGYTYLGQFIDHDISRVSIVAKGDELLINIPFMVNERTSFLDLESVYGKGPARNPELYENNTRLKVGETLKVQEVKKKFPNDLPRKNGTSIAELVEDRNDENLIVAQTHLAFIKFHNAVVKYLGNDDTPETFQKARETVVRHFQWIVLYDFLPKIVKTSVWKDVVENDNFISGYSPTPKNPYVPIEFSGAAFRFGHSMVRDTYQWNWFFREGIKKKARLSQLAELTGSQGLSESTVKQLNLPSVWVIDWRRFYEFSGKADPKDINFNFAKKIDTTIATSLGRLKAGGVEFPLAARNLLSGRKFALPTGQFVAGKMNVEPLASADIRRLLPAELPEEFKDKFDRKTPLWFYILAEAQLQGENGGLGEIGSRIVAETLVGLIKVSPISILNPVWEPKPGQDKATQFGMTDLLEFVAEHGERPSGTYDAIDPIGNPPVN